MSARIETKPSSISEFLQLFGGSTTPVKTQLSAVHNVQAEALRLSIALTSVPLHKGIKTASSILIM